MRPGSQNSITDIPGILVGNSESATVRTGTTVLYLEEPAVASVAILGGAPGTREAALLDPRCTVEAVDALVLSGGSAFGLDAASGAQAALAERNRGFPVGPVRVPIVPAAILFDLTNGGDKKWGEMPPYRQLGRMATEAAGTHVRLGRSGAGYGATTATGVGGLGTASTVLPSGITVGALVAVNAVGSAKIAGTDQFWAAPFEIDGEFGGHGWPAQFTPKMTELRMKGVAAEHANTTIGVIATDASLTKAQAESLAIMAHDGFARALWPAHTPLDGDLVFAVSTRRWALENPPIDLARIGAAAANTMARAIARGVYEAERQMATAATA